MKTEQPIGTQYKSEERLAKHTISTKGTVLEQRWHKQTSPYSHLRARNHDGLLTGGF